MNSLAKAVVFDVGRVLYEWDLRNLFAKLIADEGALDWFFIECCDRGMAFPA